MQSPNVWKNAEMIVRVKFSSGSDDYWTWYTQHGRNIDNG